MARKINKKAYLDAAKNAAAATAGSVSVSVIKKAVPTDKLGSFAKYVDAIPFTLGVVLLTNKNPLLKMVGAGMAAGAGKDLAKSFGIGGGPTMLGDVETFDVYDFDSENFDTGGPFVGSTDSMPDEGSEMNY